MCHVRSCASSFETELASMTNLGPRMNCRWLLCATILCSIVHANFIEDDETDVHPDYEVIEMTAGGTQQPEEGNAGETAGSASGNNWESFAGLQERFLNYITRVPIPMEDAEAACIRLKDHVPLFVPTSQVPSKYDVSPWVQADGRVPAHAVVLAALPHQAESISLLACLAERSVLNATLLPDAGRSLLYTAVSKKHMRLMSLLLQQGVRTDYVDPDTGFTVLHAVVENGMLSLDMATHLLEVIHLGQLGEEHSAAKSSQGVTPQQRLGLKVASYPRWLARIVATIAKHVPKFLADEVETAWASLLATSRVISDEGNPRLSAMPRDVEAGVAVLDTVPAAALGMIANGLSTLMLRLIMEKQLEETIAATRSVHMDRVKEGTLKGHWMASSAVGYASSVQLIQVLEARDMNGRTVFHLAAEKNNDVTLSHLLLAARRTGDAAWKHANSTGVKPEVVPPQGAFSAMVAAAVARVKDYMGFTARHLACSLGSHRAAKILHMAEAIVLPPPVGGGKEEDEDPCEEFKDAPTGKEASKAWSGVYVPPSSAWDSPLPVHDKASTLLTSLAHRTKGRAGQSKGAHMARGGVQVEVLAADAVQASQSSPNGFLPSTCDLPVLDAREGITPAAFVDRYVLHRQPVLIRGSKDGVALMEALAKESLLARAGDVSFPVVTIPYGRAFGVPPLSSSMSLALYVQEVEGGREGELGPLAYVFDTPSKKSKEGASSLLSGVSLTPSFLEDTLHVWDGPKEASKALNLVARAVGGGNSTTAKAAKINPTGMQVQHGSESLNKAGVDVPVLSASHSPNVQFYIGGPASGAPLHYHKDAVNIMAAGQKRWFLLPPQHALYSTIPAADWVSALVSNSTSLAAYASTLQGHLLECTQEAGDALYVPFGWGHAVLNTGKGFTVGVAVEFSTPIAPLAK